LALPSFKLGITAHHQDPELRSGSTGGTTCRFRAAGNHSR
jgi:hypothetical protein